MYPNTKFDYVDQSTITAIDVPGIVRPLFVAGFSSDKGPEGLRVVDNTNIEKIYGKASFIKHGQPQIQAYRSAASGARLLTKRVVAPNATLANTIICANVKTIQEQKKDATGALVYKTVGNVETTIATGNTAVMIKKASLKYTTHTAVAAANMAAVSTAANALLAETINAESCKVYPVLALTDIGRGLSSKKFRISPDYDGSKKLDFLKFELMIIDNNESMEKFVFSMNHEKVYQDESYSMESVVNPLSTQVQAIVFESNLDKLMLEMAACSTDLPATFVNADIIFGKDKTGSAMQQVVIDPASVNLSTPIGIALSSGTNGSFANNPTVDPGYETGLTAFFNGTFDDSIFDVDLYKIDAIIDANYTAAVKRAIESLVIFREDCVFMEDLGLISSYATIKSVSALAVASKFISMDHLSYDVLDPASRKQVTVTSGYSFSKMLVEHMAGGRNRPFAGELHNAVINDAIPGTINYIPKVTPTVNQKEQLADLRVNYASMQDDKLILQTQYTNSPVFSQFSYLGNVLAIQEVVKAVRTRCPKIRYNWLDGAELTAYKQDVRAVLSQFTGNFESLEFEYIQDPAYVQNKIFRAAIKVKFRNYTEAEYFTIYAIS